MSDETPPPSYERDNSRSPKAHIEGHGAGKPYKPHDVITETTQAAIVSFVAASFLAGLKNSFSKQNLGVTGVLTAQAPILGLVTAAPTTYMFVRGATNNLMGREDAWGSAAGGFAAGAILGLPSKRMPVVMGLGAAVGLSQGLFTLFGDRLGSFKQENDEFERKESIRRTTRIPVEQTIREVGEGRGIRGPGYEERRREHLKEKFGVEINPVRATVDGSE
ncbi:NADH-ubiquinone oxidoreductase 21.3 kDa subunit-like protein [Emericellopsis cladophorae]|uniref:NADH-ubiquinone oxidoreductase 21.3 kDa subunit-like protein n=1 Tax=Emericellopsis cladophorae TaxID=2686198 RepID=A0A9P9XXZ8_9HYPO|nr:NADH-ubiquinone oxidoreductase 21.3 kDa subunit-like protein [Emericellopsis cladophorae]KAI6779938.1 NADH-ubiquinone oxidoreductase 21.3 kDa subunit-like protein [Emericellopsis cladophorae]